MRRSLFLLAAVLSIGCSASQVGLDQLNSGKHKEAFATFQKCANAGDPYCINNLGVMYERGFVTGTRDVPKAIQYFTLAARMGLSLARQNLIQLGAPVPGNDLEAAYRVEQERKAAANRALGQALLQAAQSPTYQAPQQPQAANQAYGGGQPTHASPGTIVPANCTGDVQCGSGRICVKPANTLAKGICVSPVDELGMRSLEIPTPSVGPREVPACEFVTDCPIGFRCAKQAGQFYGLCMK